MIDAGMITVDVLLTPDSRPEDLHVKRAALTNERTLKLMDRLAKSTATAATWCRSSSASVPARIS